MKKLTFSIIFLTLFSSMTLFASSCSNKLPQETPPSIVETTETTETTPSEEETSTEESLPQSSARFSADYSAKHGRIAEDKGFFADKDGNRIYLKGLFCDYEAMPEGFYNKDTFQTFAEDWGCGLMEIPVFENHNGAGFINEGEDYLNQICEYINFCNDFGMYAVVSAEGKLPSDSSRAADFFKRLSAIYSGNEAVLYEISGNESEDEDYKKYRDTIINSIRENDPESLIICETNDLESVAGNPVKGDNIAYITLYDASENFQEKLENAQSSGIPVIVSYDSNSPVNHNESWVYRDIVKLFVPDIDKEKLTAGHWSDDMLNTGINIRMIIGI